MASNSFVAERAVSISEGRTSETITKGGKGKESGEKAWLMERNNRPYPFGVYPIKAKEDGKKKVATPTEVGGKRRR